MKQIATLLSLMLSSKLLLAQTLSDQINNFFEPIVAVMAKDFLIQLLHWVLSLSPAFLS